MYQIQADIFRKIEKYISIARQFKEHIKEIQVSNEIEEYFGREYCRVYVKFELKESSANHCEFYEAIRANFRYDEKEYFSFYLTTDRRDNEYALRNTKENTHYDYIWNLLEWNLREEDIRVKAEILKVKMI